jgi:hypothetical protein
MTCHPVTVLAAALLLGCAARPEMDMVDSTDLGRANGRLAIRRLLQEHSSGHADPARRVITDATGFQAAWDQAYARRGQRPPLPVIDFSREAVILASLGTRSTGGYTIDIDSVRAGSTVLEVFVRTTSPGPTCGATAALTQPVVMVALPRTRLPVRFEEDARLTNCG